MERYGVDSKHDVVSQAAFLGGGGGGENRYRSIATNFDAKNAI